MTTADTASIVRTLFQFAGAWHVAGTEHITLDAQRNAQDRVVAEAVKVIHPALVELVRREAAALATNPT